MGIPNHKKETHEIYTEGSTGSPALNGGYLYVYMENELLSIISIPSPYLGAENKRESEVVNHEEFIDEKNNNFSISVYSSMYGIEWHLEDYPDDLNILKKIKYQVKYNEF